MLKGQSKRHQDTGAGRAWALAGQGQDDAGAAQIIHGPFEGGETIDGWAIRLCHDLHATLEPAESG